MTEEEKNTLIISIERLATYDADIKNWVLKQINEIATMTPEDLEKLKEQVAELIKQSQLEII